MSDPTLSRVRVPGAPRAADRLARAFPALHVSHSPGDDPAVDLAAWTDPAFDPRRLDPVVAGALGSGAAGLSLEPSGLPEPRAADAALQVVTRYQRYVRIRNEASRTPAFQRALDSLRALHARPEPLVQADRDHAEDTWRWVLRLDPRAGAALQLAALFHDVERLESEAAERVEHRAGDYRAFKNAHARRGAALAAKVLDLCGIPPAECARAARLIAGHEDPSHEREAALLADADALSFFSLNSPGFVDHYGAAHARRKVAHTLARLSGPAAALLAGIRLRSDVALLLDEARAAA